MRPEKVSAQGNRPGAPTGASKEKSVRRPPARSPSRAHRNSVEHKKSAQPRHADSSPADKSKKETRLAAEKAHASPLLTAVPSPVASASPAVPLLSQWGEALSKSLFGAATSVTSAGEPSSSSMPAPADSQWTSEPAGPSQEVTEWSKKFNGRRLTKPNEDIFIGKGAMGAEKLFQSILRGETDWMTPVVRGATKYETAKNLFESENFWTDETPGYERSYVPITQRILEATTLDNPGEWLDSRKVSKFQELPDDKLSSLVFANDAAQYTPISGRRFFELMDATGDAGPSIVLGLGKRVGLFSRSLFTRDDRLTAKPVAIFDTREFLAKLNDKAAPLSNSAPYAETAERAFKELLILALEKPKAKEGNGQLGDMLASAPAYYKEVRQIGGRPISRVEFANAVMKAVRELSPQRGAHFFWHGIGRISQNDAKTLINLKSSSFHAKDSVLQRAVAILEEEAAPKVTPT